VIALSSQTGGEAITFWRTGPTPAAALTYAGRVGSAGRDPATGEYFHFVNNQVHGHPYGMHSTANSLSMADLAWTGRLDASVSGVPANEAGVIYRITPVPEPAAWASVVAGLAIASVRGRWRRRCRTPSAASPTSATARKPGSGTTEKVTASS
jgi:hypothetical protein